ncbi:MAG TPA: NUMOD4 domain-containing protein [Saprospiraceae bacterium]|nr:NUMOD4 domain-containing protein [Saprospiraceae bacterium]
MRICTICGIEYTPKQNFATIIYKFCSKKCKNKNKSIKWSKENFRNIQNIDGEKWAIIIDYENYMVSNLGRIKNTKHDNGHNLLKPSFHKSGYYKVSLTNKEGRKTQNLHRLIAKAFIPNPYNKPYINHKNGITSDNTLENLEWCTASENTQHAYDIGLIKKRPGELSASCKLKECDVINIIRRVKYGAKVKDSI